MEPVNKSIGAASEGNETNKKLGKDGGMDGNNGKGCDESVDTIVSSDSDPRVVHIMCIVDGGVNEPVNNTSSDDVRIYEAMTTQTLHRFMLDRLDGGRHLRFQDGMLLHARALFSQPENTPFVCRVAKPFYKRYPNGGCYIHSKHFLFAYWFKSILEEETGYKIIIHFVRQTHLVTLLVEHHLSMVARETTLTQQIDRQFSLILRCDGGNGTESQMLDYVFGFLGGVYIDNFPCMEDWTGLHPMLQYSRVRKFVKKMVPELNQILDV